MGENVLRDNLYPAEGNWLWSWPFENKEILNDPKLVRSINQKDILNKINHLHFIGDSFQIFFQDIHTQEKILLQAKIKSCTETTMICIFSDKTDLDINNLNYQITHIAMDDGKNLILMPTFLISKNNKFFTIQLPDAGYEVNQRQVRRHSCRDIIDVELLQDGLTCKGTLLEFSSFDCRVQLKSSMKFHFNKDSPISISFYHGKELYHSCHCYLIRGNDNSLMKEIVLKFVRNSKPLVPKNHQCRNPRLRLTPSPSITYFHPIIQKWFCLEITNISSSGFCAYESEDESVLMEGISIPDLSIHFSDVFQMQFSVKVIYCLLENKNTIRCGFSIMDMDMTTYNRLMKILNHALDSNIYLNNTISMGSLWDFFFNVNFIYSKKYHYLSKIHKEINKTYIALYQKNLEISMHLTYQKNGFIYGHFSALHAYENTWLQHHHAAKVVDNKPVGFLMLKHLIHYFKDMHRFPSLKTNFLMGYYRPENKFPEKVFGGFYNFIADRKKCSMDLFAYIENKKPILLKKLPKGWLLRPTTSIDLKHLNNFYTKISNGLLLKALGLEGDNLNFEYIEELFRKNGFFRSVKVYTLCFENEIYAILFIDQSNPGLNLSDLLNNIKILVLKTENLPWKILSASIFQLITQYRMGFIPILIFPIDYVKINNIIYNKQYQLWICHSAYYYHIIKYLEDKFRLRYWNY